MIKQTHLSFCSESNKKKNTIVCIYTLILSFLPLSTTHGKPFVKYSYISVGPKPIYSHKPANNVENATKFTISLAL